MCERDKNNRQFFLSKHQMFIDYITHHFLKPKLKAKDDQFKYSIEYKMYMAIIYNNQFYQELRKRYRVLNLPEQKLRVKRKKAHTDKYYRRISKNKLNSDRTFAKFIEKIGKANHVKTMRTSKFKYISRSLFKKYAEQSHDTSSQNDRSLSIQARGSNMTRPSMYASLFCVTTCNLD